jgi:hypothetical protein
MEYLREDFLAFVSDLTDVSALRRLRVRRVGRVNEDTYNHSLRSWFRDSHLELMYDRNPLWTELERKVYGGTLLDRS